MTFGNPARVALCGLALLLARSEKADAEVIATAVPAPAGEPTATPGTLRDASAAVSTSRLLATCRASRRSGPISVDGLLDDPAWLSAPRNGGFTQRFPKQGAVPTLATEFSVLYDDDSLYVGVWSNDPQPDLVKGLLTRRDQESPSDSVTVAIDSYRDRRTAFAFSLNPASVQRDQIIFDNTNSDDSWDAVWSGASALGTAGWTAEFRIPLSQLRFSSDPSQRWGLQVSRLVARTGEEMSWSPWPRSEPEIVSRFGTIDGIDGVKPGRRIELLPYVTAGIGSRPVDAGDPLNDEVNPEGNLGLDAKYGLSSAFSLAATLNPDFGQVEADPSQVNLSANELFFPEKRPFFLDGVELFKIGLGSGDGNSETLFYSRRIGAAPHGSVDGDFVKSPTSTTIYGAAKISGKTSSGWSLGILDAVTGQEQAEFIDADGRKGTQIVEPLTNFALAKLKRDFREGNTTISISASAVNRDLEDTGLSDELHDQAYTGGLELFHRFFEEKISLSGKLLGSYVHGSKQAIADTQQLTRHLYQRPDAKHLTFDPERTSLAGAAAVVGLTYRDPHWQVGMGVDSRTAGLEVNDLGFQRSADQFQPFAYGSYRDNDPGARFLSYRVNVNAYSASDLEPRLLAAGGNVNGNGQLKNYWRVGGGLEGNHNRWQPTALRGGAALRAEDSLGGWVFVESDTRKRFSFGLESSYFAVPASNSYSGDVALSANLQAASNLILSLAPRVALAEDDEQYIDQVDDDAGVTRYLLGRIRQTSTSLTMRVSWTFSPRLSLQAYAQPFVATGGYQEYKEAVAPNARDRSARFATLRPGEFAIADDVVTVDRDGNGVPEYSFDRPDFGFRELNSTLVLRWEYRPGSSLFAIWSHGQSAEDSDGDFQLGRGLARLGRAEAEDIVMVKANYWIGL
jgi:hypothetical protein